MPTVVERVDRLEDLMAQMLETTAQTSRELREFKDEMREFKDETRAASAAADAYVQAYIVRSEREMREFKAEMRNLEKQMRRDRGEINRDIGRLVENIVAPGIPKIFREITGLSEGDIDFSAIRVKKKKPAEREFDAVIAGGCYLLINETKATLRPEYVKEFHQLMTERIHDYFPEYAGKRFIGIVSSLYADDSIIVLGSRLGLYVLGFGDDLLDVLNPREFTPRYF